MDITLKYVGPKALYSAHGISFVNAKEDKFVYLSILAELIEALDHDYIDNKRYIADVGNTPLDQTTLLELIRKRPSNLDEQIEYWIAKTTQEIDEDIKRAHDNHLLKAEEKEVLNKNLEILRPYRIQRSINKSVYYAGVKLLASIIKQGSIEYIVTPMYPKFLHVLHSVQGALHAIHPPVDSKIDIYEEHEHLFVELKILSNC